MAIPHLNAAIVSRGTGGNAVHAAAYAARARIVDMRTGRVFDYSADQADVMFSGVFLPKGAPARLRDLDAFTNAMEASEKNKNARTARTFIVALPVELTEQQREWLLQDYGKENFTRKGLGYHAAIHCPHAHGDERNFHAHITVSVRTIDASGFGEKHLESDRKETFDRWRDSWEKMTNRHLERHGYEARIDMRTLEAQGIDRMPQIHLGKDAAAAERKGIKTERGDRLREIINDNQQGRGLANDNDRKRAVGKEFGRAAGRGLEQQPPDWTAGKEFARDFVAPSVRRDWTAGQEIANDNQPGQRLAQPETIDRDRQDAAWQDAIDSAAIAYAEERRQQFHQTQATDRARFERDCEAMTARHAATWGEIGQRHQAETARLFGDAVHSYQPGTMAEAEQAASSGISFLLGLFTSWAESITRSVSGSSKAQPKRQRSPDKAKEQETTRQADQLREAHTREMEAVMQEQAREREAYERRRAQMLFEQAGAMQSFEQAVGDKSSMREAFEKHTEQVDGYKAYRAEQAEKAERTASLEGRDREGPELGG